PVPDRGTASGFLVLSGHAESAYRPILESLAPNSVTVVVLMGLATRARLAEVMLASGWSANTPVAISFAASTGRAYTWLAALDELAASEIPDQRADAPPTISISELASLSHQISLPSAAR